VSALEARIRLLAREELAAAGTTPAASDSSDRVAALEQAVATLSDSVLRLEARVDAMTKTAAEQEPRPVARRSRKADSE